MRRHRMQMRACMQSCLIKRYCEKRFVSKYTPTIGVDYGVTRCVWSRHVGCGDVSVRGVVVIGNAFVLVIVSRHLLLMIN